MRQHLRLALPLLSDLTSDTNIAFVLVGRDGRAARSGQLPLAELGAEAGALAVCAILHPDDAVVSDITVPPVSNRRLGTAVAGSIEPMALSDVSQLCVAHSARAADGNVTVAWSARLPLVKAWALLAEAGLNIAAFIPQSLALPADDPAPAEPLGLPAGPRWLAPLPSWSLAQDELRPLSAKGQWRKPIYWSAAAVVVWAAGLNWYAVQLANEVESLQQGMQSTVVQAFPHIPVVIDPVRQAQRQLDAQRLAHGAAAEDDFMPLALATAKVLDFAQSHVRGLHYDKGVLTLTLAEGYVPPGSEAVLAQAAAIHQLQLQKDEDRPHVWHVQRPALAQTTTRRP